MFGQRAGFSGWLCDFGYSMPGPFGMLLSLLIWAAVILLLVKVIQFLFFSGRRSGDESSIRILKDRYAEGEISKEEFEQIKKDIG